MSEGNYFRIAIDGPGGAGKSTVAKELAKILSIEYIDTGAMYRAIGYKLIKEQIDAEDEAAVKAVLESTNIDFKEGNIFLDGKNVEGVIRSPEASKMASKCAAIASVREKLVSIQREMGQVKSVIMDGRDIGTNVLKDAEYKYFIVADASKRAERRHRELLEKGRSISYEEVFSEITERDRNDTNRELNPLRKAEDAVEIDTTNMTAEDVVNYIVKEVKKHGNDETV